MNLNIIDFGRVTRTCIIIGSGDGSLSVCCHTTTLTNDDILWTGKLECTPVEFEYLHYRFCWWKRIWKYMQRRGYFGEYLLLNSLRPRQNGRHFADDIFNCISLIENIWIPIKLSLKFVPRGPINNIPALVQIMAWRRLGDKPLSEPMMDSLPTHICVTRPQRVKSHLIDNPRSNEWV